MAAMKNFLIYFYFYDLLNAKLSRVSYSLITFEYQRMRYFPLSINPLCRWITCRMPTQTVRLRLRLRQKDRACRTKCNVCKNCAVSRILRLMNKIDRQFRLMLKLYPPPHPTGLRDDG